MVATVGYQWAETPDGTHDFQQRTFALIRARHETVNGRFKDWRCLKQQWRHSLEKHGAVFRAVAGVVQVAIQNGEQLFQVEYNDADFSSDWPSSGEEMDEESDWDDL